MLVMTQKPNDESNEVIITCQCGCRGVVRVIGQKWSTLRIGYEFPKTTTINRRQIHERIQAEQPPRNGNR